MMGGNCYCFHIKFPYFYCFSCVDLYCLFITAVGAECLVDLYHGGCGGLGGRAEGGLAGHQGGQLLDAHGLLGVQQIVHTERVFARRFCR